MTITTDLNTQHSKSNSRPQNSRSKKLSAALLLGGAGLAALGFSRRGWQRISLAAAGAYLGYEGINQTRAFSGTARVSYTIGREPEEVYRFIRDSANWPKFSAALKMDPQRNSFILTLGRPFGMKIHSHAEVTDEQEGKFIAWSSLPGVLEHRGVVHFFPAPGGRGTEVSVALEYKIPGRMFSKSLALVRGKDPEQSVRETLRVLKQIMECGEHPTVTGQPAGKRGFKGAALRVMYREPQPEPPSAPGEAQLAGD